MKPVKEFIERYLREYDFYAEAARLAADYLKSDLDEAGIRAIVTNRAKDAGRLKEKCEKRQHKAAYRSVDEIYSDIVDLAGVRIALYFPGEREQVDKSIRKRFKLLEEPRTFPQPGKAPDGKRFTGYSAVHYRVSLPEETLPSALRRYAAARVEIQVASVLMHAWSEVEHDLAYKPQSGTLSDAEKAILDELNGLVLTGEIALEQLQQAVKERSSIRGRRFDNHYDLAAFLAAQATVFLAEPISDARMGRVDQLFELLRRLELDTPEKLAPYLRALHADVEVRPLSEQVVDELLAEDATRYKLWSTVQAKRSDWRRAPKESGKDKELRRFISTWVAFEQAVRDRLPRDERLRRAPFPTEKELRSAGIVDKRLLADIEALRQMRNRLVHGHDLPYPHLIASATDALSALLAQLQNQARDDARALLKAVED